MRVCKTSAIESKELMKSVKGRNVTMHESDAPATNRMCNSVEHTLMLAKKCSLIGVWLGRFGLFGKAAALSFSIFFG